MAKRVAAQIDAEVVANQVFLAIPWKTVRPKYEAAVKALERKFPLSFIIVGRDDNQDAEDLLEVIKRKLKTSSYAIFDATGGNANVSLEFGFADAMDIPRALYVSIHKASKKATKESPIIADLAGKKQNRYANAAGLRKLLTQFSGQHSYTKRFAQVFAKSRRGKLKSAKRRSRSLAIKLIHQLRNDGTARRADVIQNLQADPSGYTRDEITEMISTLHGHELVKSVQGPHSTVTVT